MRVAFVFPGQGSQSLGMLASLAAASKVIAETFAEASATLGYDLWKLVQDGPPEELNRTERTQPAMLTAGVATYRFWREAGGQIPDVVCGHSLGEFTALVCAEALAFAPTIDLVAFRARVMQEAVPEGSRCDGGNSGARGCASGGRMPRGGARARSSKRSISMARAKSSSPGSATRCSAPSRRRARMAPSARCCFP